jgi:hypothetical protein
MKKKSLEWGETPWDNMTRDELLFQIKRMYSALRSLYAVVKMEEVTQENHPYFGKEGVGGDALEKGRQIIEPLFNQYKGGEEDIYRSFFRYADDLLFDQSTEYTTIGSRWHVCPECGMMIGENPNGEKLLGRRCGDVSPNEKCNGILRALTWDDLKKGE